MDDRQIERQAGKDGEYLPDVQGSGCRLDAYEGNHSTAMETKKKPGIARMLHDLFVQKGELCPTDARRLLKEAGRKTSYVTVQRLFYDLRQLAMIEFVKEVPGKAPIDKRYYRIVPVRWMTLGGKPTLIMSFTHRLSWVV